ncbi:MAG: SpoIIE family protein phosphatase [Acidobacteriaceae bacterium]
MLRKLMDHFRMVAGRKCGVLLGATLAIAAGFAMPAIAGAQLSSSQPQKTISVGIPEVNLDGKWQFHPGDSPFAAKSNLPLWADPAFDDSGWEPVNADTLGDQKIPYSQFSWYRRQVTIDRQNPAQKLAVLVGAANTFEVYWNGRLLGGVGKVPPRFNWPYFDTAAFPLPLSDGPSASGVLAIRVWCQYPSSIPDDCGFLRPPVIGDVAQEQRRPLERFQSEFVSDYLFVGVLMLALLAAIASFLVYLRGKRNALYLWFAIFLLGAAANQLSPYWTSAGNWVMFLAALSIGAISGGFLLLLLWLSGLQHRPRLRRAVAAVAVLIAAVHTFDGMLGLFWAHAGKGIQRADAVATVLIIFLTLAPLVLLVIAVVHKGAKRDWPVILTGSAFFVSSSLVNISGQWPDLIHWHMDWVNESFRVGYFDYAISLVLLVLLLLALGTSVFRHFLAERRRQESIEHELLAAREIQRVLVPEKVPAVPGYAIASVYRPASEVGGDFFQIFSLEGGGTLVAIGDVSGKGMKAAMIVSLIVGSLRTIASYTQQPAEILKQLNMRLHGRMSGGFVTCLVLRITADQQILASHAGHLAPYIDGEEVTALPGSLPLGLVPDVEYEEAMLDLARGKTLTLITDGVLEAQSASNELFGFERLASLLASRPSAEQIAETACNFGQEDDITVLTLTRLEHGVEAATVLLTPEPA